MTVGDEVRSSLDHWSVGEWRQAVWHATSALEQTAVKRYPTLDPADAFRETIRADVDVLSAMAAPDIDLEASRFPLPVASDLPDQRPDIADVLYAVYRHLQGQADALPAGFEVVPHVEGEPLFNISEGKLWLRASAALGLLAIAVFSPVNKGQEIPGTYHLGWQQHIFHVVGWWGWRDHFREIVSNADVPRFALDFTPEWDNWQPTA